MTTDPIERLDEGAGTVALRRTRPLLVLYYPSRHGRMHMRDTEDAYAELRRAGFSKEQKLESIDVLLHTWGGNPTAAYRMAQMLRSFSNDLVFIVPEHAMSAGTLLTLADNRILLGDNAGLSPFDITLVEPTPPPSEVSLASVDSFIEFAIEARKQIERLLRELDSKQSTSIDSDLLCRLVEQEGALKIGEYCRERLLTARYAEVLLRGGLVCLNSAARFDKWNRAAVR